MRRARVIAGMSAAAVATLVLGACSGGGGGEQSGTSKEIKDMATGKAQTDNLFKLKDVPPSGEVKVGVDEGYSAYNNNTPETNSSYNNYVLTAVLTGTHIYDGNNKVLLNGDVMDSVTVKSKDPQVVEWKIKPGVKWSDGAPWSCKDFYLAWLANTGTAKGPDGAPAFTPVQPTGYDRMDQVTCKDDQTLEAHFTKPYLDYQQLFTTTVLPAHVLEQQTGIADVRQLKPTGDPQTLKKAGDFWNKKWTDFNPATMPASGPYKITSYDSNQQSVVLEKNPNWAGAKGGPSRILVKAFPDTKAMATALQNNEIDVMASTQPDATAAGTIKNLEAQGVQYGSASQLTYEHLDLQYRRMFADKALRKAFFEAVNRNEIVDKLLKPVQDDASPLNSLLFYQGDPRYKDNYSDKAGTGAQAASKTLEDAGWRKGPDGIYAKDGKRFSVAITHNDNERRRQTVEIIIAQARAAGIEVRDETDPNFLKGRLDTGNWDIALFGWSQEPFKAVSQPIYTTGGNQNHQKVAIPAVDQAYDKAVTASEPAASTADYQAADKALADDYASLPLFQTPSMWGFRNIDRVFMQSYNGALWNVGEWERKEG